MPTIAEVRQQYPQYKDMSDDALASALHAKFYSDMPKADFMAKVGLDDPIKAQVRQEIADQRKSGALPAGGDGYARQFLQGRTMGLADEALAALTTPLEMIKRRTFNPATGYQYAKARENVLMEEARDKGGMLGTGAEIAGGILTGSQLGRAGLTAMPANPATATTARNIGGVVADSAAFGALTGAAEGSGVEDRLMGALKGGAAGAAGGAVVGTAIPVASAVGRNTLGWLSATRNPEAYAERQLARSIMDSGKSADDVARAVQEAGASGQPYTVADALGNPGQRLLSSVARAPGDGRTKAVEFLEGRQGAQGRRIAQSLADAFDAATTSGQSKVAREGVRSAEADVNYARARQMASRPVDVSQSIDNLLGELPKQAAAGGSDTADLVNRIGRKLVDKEGNPLTDFSTLLNAKKEIDAIISMAERSGDKNAMRIGKLAQGPLDEALARASNSYSRARDTFRLQSDAINAIDEGKLAATRGRTEDTIQRFGEMRPRGHVNGMRVNASDQQQGFREGYVDPLIEAVQGGAVGVNKARPFSSDASKVELKAFAAKGKGDKLVDALARENTMFETRAHALGGSRTADNLADEASLGVNPEIITNLMSGNFLAAGKNALSRSSNALSGNTTEVRSKLADLLLQGGTPELRDVLTRTFTNEENRRRAIAQALRGAIAGTAAGSGNVNQQRQIK